MTDHPFHVAGGMFAKRPQETAGLVADFVQAPRSTGELAAIATGSRRRKLWEIGHKCHCPIIGVCFEVDELRRLMAKVMFFPPDTTDFVLHTTAVGNCENRSRLAELLHKQLEKRYVADIRQFANCRDSNSLRQHWQAACRNGTRIPGALWAAWSNPACDATLQQEIYADIHMIQHQIGSGTRVDHTQMQQLQRANADLQQQLNAARQETLRLRQQASLAQSAQERRILELQAESTGKDAALARLNGELEKLRQSLPDMKDRQALARRASDAESLLKALTARSARQDEAQEQLLRHIASLEARLVALDASTDERPDDTSERDLAGKCVLCVGGRPGSVDAYRKLVERSGGRFLHHDGGQEESLHRVDGVLAAADLVICQTGCISHNAYWRVKEQCKRTGKQCLFVKNSGTSSFERLLHNACHPGSEIPQEAGQMAKAC